MILYNLTGPFAEMYGAFIVDLKSYRNGHLEIIVKNLSLDISASFLLNYPIFSDSCFLGQFSISINLLNMIIYTPLLMLFDVRSKDGSSDKLLLSGSAEEMPFDAPHPITAIRNTLIARIAVFGEFFEIPMF